MEVKARGIYDNYKYTSEKQNVKKTDDNSSGENSGSNESEIKILIAQLQAAKSSFEASLYLTKIKAALSKIQGSDENLPLINKVKKIIQSGNKKVEQLKEEEALAAEKKKAEINNDREEVSEIDADIQKKRRRHMVKENDILPKTESFGGIHFEDISINLGANFDVLV